MHMSKEEQLKKFIFAALLMAYSLLSADDREEKDLPQAARPQLFSHGSDFLLSATQKNHNSHHWARLRPYCRYAIAALLRHQ